MRRLSACCLAISLIPAFSGRADLTITQKVEGAGQNGDIIVKVKGDKERIEAPSQPTRIIDGRTGEMADLLNDKKQFLKISAEQMKAAAETINKFDDAKQPPSEKKLKPTGKKETINGYETEEYVFETPQYTASFWVASKYPGSANVLKQLEAPIAGAWRPSNMGMPEYTDFPGVPIRTVIEVGGNKVVTTITSIKQDALAASEFEIPKDFQELKKPLDTAPPPVETLSPAATP